MRTLALLLPLTLGGCEPPAPPKAAPRVPPSPVAVDIPALRFKAEAVADQPGAWRCTYGKAAFRFEIGKAASAAGSPFAFATGALSRLPGSDGAALLMDLARILEARKPPSAAVEAVERLDFRLVILGEELSRGGTPEIAGSFSSAPKGSWIATKLFLADGEAELFLNLDPAAGVGEFAMKDSAYGDAALTELAKVLR